jgi:hypothetical protein
MVAGCGGGPARRGPCGLRALRAAGPAGRGPRGRGPCGLRAPRAWAPGAAGPAGAGPAGCGPRGPTPRAMAMPPRSVAVPAGGLPGAGARGCRVARPVGPARLGPPLRSTHDREPANGPSSPSHGPGARSLRPVGVSLPGERQGAGRGRAGWLSGSFLASDRRERAAGGSGLETPSALLRRTQGRLGSGADKPLRAVPCRARGKVARRAPAAGPDRGRAQWAVPGSGVGWEADVP